jgi:hypothetical protein
MGFKASFIIVENAENQQDETTILNTLGFVDFGYDSEVFFEQCMYPHDKGVYIGYYRGNLIVCHEDLPSRFFANRVIGIEKQLTTLFPDREIMSVMCHSVVNYHGYALSKNGVKLRTKQIAHDSPLQEFGERLEEENAIYATSTKDENGANFWKNYHGQNYDCTEDQLMEDFTFGVAKRLLGVMISTSEDEELLFETPFRKFVKQEKVVTETTTNLTENNGKSTQNEPFSHQNDLSTPENQAKVATGIKGTIMHNPAKAFFVVGAGLSVLLFWAWRMDRRLSQGRTMAEQSDLEQIVRSLLGNLSLIAPSFLLFALIYWLLYYFKKPTQPLLNFWHFTTKLIVAVVSTYVMANTMEDSARMLYSEPDLKMKILGWASRIPILIFWVNIGVTFLKKK